MKRAFKSFIFCVLMFLCVQGGYILRAQAAETSIAVVDVVRILTQSEPAKNIQAERERLRTSFLSEISKAEQALSQEEKALLKSAETLPKEEYAKKRSAYEQKLMTVRKEAQGKKRLLEESSRKAMDDLRDQLYVVVQEIAREKGYALVISNKDVIAGEKSLDITEETLRRLNEKTKNASAHVGE